MMSLVSMIVPSKSRSSAFIVNLSPPVSASHCTWFFPSAQSPPVQRQSRLCYNDGRKSGKLIRQQIDRRKKESPGSGNEPSAESAGIHYDDAGPEEALVLRDALTSLPEEDRNIVLLSVVAGFKSREIADMTGLTAGSVRSRLSRNLKKLRAFLEEMEKRS